MRWPWQPRRHPETRPEPPQRRTNAAGESAVICPDCGSDKWACGPEGGMAINVRCGRCGAKFNYTPFGLERMR